MSDDLIWPHVWPRVTSVNREEQYSKIFNEWKKERDTCSWKGSLKNEELEIL